jgi:hypothetical protein
MGTVHVDQYTFFISRSFLFKMGNVSDKSCRENQSTRGFFFFPKSVRCMRNMEKYCRVGQGTDHIMAHAYCMLDT